MDWIGAAKSSLLAQETGKCDATRKYIVRHRETVIGSVGPIVSGDLDLVFTPMEKEFLILNAGYQSINLKKGMSMAVSLSPSIRYIRMNG